MAHGSGSAAADEEYFSQIALPVLVAGAGDAVRTVHSFDPTSGNLQWSYELPAAPVYAHVWEHDRAISVDLHLLGEDGPRDDADGTLSIQEHEGTLYARKGPRYELTGEAARLHALGRGVTGLIGAPSGELAEAPGQILLENDGTPGVDRMMLSLKASCRPGEAGYPQCMVGQYPAFRAQLRQCVDEDDENCHAPTLAHFDAPGVDGPPTALLSAPRFGESQSMLQLMRRALVYALALVGFVSATRGWFRRSTLDAHEAVLSDSLGSGASPRKGRLARAEGNFANASFYSSDESQSGGEPRPTDRSWGLTVDTGMDIKALSAELDRVSRARLHAPPLSREHSDDPDDDRRVRSISLGSHLSVQRDLDAAMAPSRHDALLAPSAAGIASSAPSSPPGPGPYSSNSYGTPQSPFWKGQMDFEESRYKKDFVELGRLGKGAFGSVFKVKQRLDESDYAIKKVRLESGDDVDMLNWRLHREVRNFSTLSNHPNIVRYYGTWQETVMGGEEDTSSMLEFTLDGTTTDGDTSAVSSVAGPQTWLFIQMELCTTSLREKLQGNEGLKVGDWREYLLNTSEGLCHMHSQHYIHRDIKPDNIFIVNVDGKEVAKLGDFGLSCKTSGRGTQLMVSLEEDSGDAGDAGDAGMSFSEHTRAVGTHTYFSPELEHGGMYDEKVDMYALGVTLLEMMHPFKTGMERIDVIRRVKETMARESSVHPHCPPHSLWRCLLAWSPRGLTTCRQPRGKLRAVPALCASPHALRVQVSLGKAIPGDDPLIQTVLKADETRAAAQHIGKEEKSEEDGDSGRSSNSTLSHAGTEVKSQRAAAEQPVLPPELKKLQAEFEAETNLLIRMLGAKPSCRPTAKSVRDAIKAIVKPESTEEKLRREIHDLRSIIARKGLMTRSDSLARITQNPSAKSGAGQLDSPRQHSRSPGGSSEGDRSVCMSPLAPSGSDRELPPAPHASPYTPHDAAPMWQTDGPLQLRRDSAARILHGAPADASASDVPQPEGLSSPGTLVRPRSGGTVDGDAGPAGPAASVLTRCRSSEARE